MSENCIFCKIINKEIPSRNVYEDEHTVAFLDLSQVTPGHTLLVPKTHVKDILEYSESLARDVFGALPKVSRAVKNHSENVEGLNVVINNGEVADQTVFHSHIHLIPRYSSEDDFDLTWANNSSDYSDEQLDAIQKSINDALNQTDQTDRKMEGL